MAMAMEMEKEKSNPFGECGEMGMAKPRPIGETKSHGGSNCVDSTDECPGIGKLQIHDKMLYGCREKPLGGGSVVSYSDVCRGLGSGFELYRDRRGVYSLQWRPTEMITDSPLAAVLADEPIAEQRLNVVNHLIHHDYESTYDFLLLDYMNRAISPLLTMFRELLDKYENWTYELALGIYEEMRSAQRFMAVAPPGFIEILALSEDLFYLQFRCPEFDMADINTKTALLRQMIKSWVEEINW